MNVILFQGVYCNHLTTTIHTSKQDIVVISDRAQCLYTGLTVTTKQISVDKEPRHFLRRAEGTRVSHVTLTHDGRYILFLEGLKMLYMRRYSDNKLLARYTVYDPVASLAVSTNNCYVIIATNDKRVLTLVIADPDEREHDERIAYVRAMNPGLRKDQAMALMGEANTFQADDHNSDSDSKSWSADSDDNEKMLRLTQKRLDKRTTDHDVIFCLQSDDESSSSDDDDDWMNKSQVTRQNTTVRAYDDGLLPTAHDGQIFATKSCSLQ